MTDGIGGSSANTDRKQTLNSYGNLNSTYSALRNLSTKSATTGTNLTSAGATDTGTASKFYSDILSGKTLAGPEITALTSGATQQKKEIANFGDRSGGKNQVAQGITADTRGKVADVTAGERDKAAGAKAGIGAGETGAGISSTGQAIDATGKAGSIAADTASIASKNRVASQDIHDQAVTDWGKTISYLLGV